MFPAGRASGREQGTGGQGTGNRGQGTGNGERGTGNGVVRPILNCGDGDRRDSRACKDADYAARIHFAVGNGRGALRPHREFAGGASAFTWAPLGRRLGGRLPRAYGLSAETAFTSRRASACQAGSVVDDSSRGAREPAATNSRRRYTRTSRYDRTFAFSAAGRRFERASFERSIDYAVNEGWADCSGSSAARQ